MKIFLYVPNGNSFVENSNFEPKPADHIRKPSAWSNEKAILILAFLWLPGWIVQRYIFSNCFRLNNMHKMIFQQNMWLKISSHGIALDGYGASECLFMSEVNTSGILLISGTGFQVGLEGSRACPLASWSNMSCEVSLFSQADWDILCWFNFYQY